MMCKLLNRSGIDFLRDPTAACPLGRWDEAEGDVSVSMSVGAGDGGVPTSPKAPQPCGGCAKTGLAKIVHGAAGLAKAAMGLERASEETIRTRSLICRTCEHYRHGFCAKCGCMIAAKVRVASEACPLHRWPSP